MPNPPNSLLNPIKTPFFLGNRSLSSNLFYAPLAGCSDFAFRRMSARYKPGLIFCEMVKMEAVIRGDEGTFRILSYDTSMHPIGAQLCGSNPKIAKEAAQIIENLGFDTLDFNCGCPVDKVTKDGSGSGMLKTPALIGDILHELVQAVKIPVTVKVRAGWDDEHINVEEVTHIAEKAGAKAITVHGRTREQGYSGPANWDYIKRSKQAAKSIIVVGNGDLMTPESIWKMYAETGCDAFLVARGTLGSPWIVEDILRFNEGKISPRSFQSVLDTLREHFKEISSHESLKKTITDMRRVGCWYFKRGMGAKAFREKMSRVTTLQEIEELLDPKNWDPSLFQNQEEHG